MRKLAFVFTFYLCASHGRRVTSLHLQERQPARDRSSSNHRTSLVSLLHPEVAFAAPGFSQLAGRNRDWPRHRAAHMDADHETVKEKKPPAEKVGDPEELKALLREALSLRPEAQKELLERPPPPEYKPEPLVDGKDMTEALGEVLQGFSEEQKEKVVTKGFFSVVSWDVFKDNLSKLGLSSTESAYVDSESFKKELDKFATEACRKSLGYSSDEDEDEGVDSLKKIVAARSSEKAGNEAATRSSEEAGNEDRRRLDQKINQIMNAAKARIDAGEDEDTSMRLMAETLKRDLTPEEFRQTTKVIPEIVQLLEKTEPGNKFEQAAIKLENTQRGDTIISGLSLIFGSGLINNGGVILIQEVEKNGLSPSMLGALGEAVPQFAIGAAAAWYFWRRTEPKGDKGKQQLLDDEGAYEGDDEKDASIW